MKIKRKFKEYFIETGVQKVWLARKLGITPASMWTLCAGKKPVPRKYWERLVEHTRGFITLEDLVHDQLEYEAKKIGIINIKQTSPTNEWIITLKSVLKP